VAHTAFSSDWWPLDGLTFRRAVPHKRHWDDVRLVMGKLGRLRGPLYPGEGGLWVDPPEICSAGHQVGWDLASTYRQSLDLVLNRGDAAGTRWYGKVDAGTPEVLGRYVRRAAGSGEISIVPDLWPGAGDGWRVPYTLAAPAHARFLSDLYVVLNALEWIRLPTWIDCPEHEDDIPHYEDFWAWPVPVPPPEDEVWQDLKDVEVPTMWEEQEEPFSGIDPGILRGMVGSRDKTVSPPVFRFREGDGWGWFLDQWHQVFRWYRVGEVLAAPSDLGAISLEAAVCRARDFSAPPWFQNEASRARGAAQVRFLSASGEFGSCAQDASAEFALALPVEDVSATLGAEIHVAWPEGRMTVVPDDTEYPPPQEVTGTMTFREYLDYFWARMDVFVKVDVAGA